MREFDATLTYEGFQYRVPAHVKKQIDHDLLPYKPGATEVKPKVVVPPTPPAPKKKGK